jgi:hypothetical protein
MARVIAALVAASAFAPARAHDAPGRHLHAFAEAGVRLLDGEPWLALRPGVVLHGEHLDLVLAPALHLGLDATGRPRLRPEDFDALTDYGRLLHRLEVTGRRERFRLRAGALAWERMGHGTVVSDFVASLDPDAPHTALRFDLETGAVRVEALAGEILAPRLLALRVATAPVAAAGIEGRAADAWEVGVLAAADPTAPIAPTGILAPGRRPGMVTAPVAIAAVDTRVTVYRDHRFVVSPYADGVITVAGPRRGRGAVHLGVLGDAALGGEVRLGGKLEARRLGSHYLAEPFDTYYSLERFGHRLGEGAPKAYFEGVEGGWGGRVELVLDQAGLGLLGIAADARAGGPANGSLHLGLHGRGGFSGAAHLALRGLGFEAGPALLSVGEIRWHVHESVYLVLRGGWIRRVDEATARHRPALDAALAIGGAI